MIADLLKADKPTQEQIHCARQIIAGLIASYDKKLPGSSSSVSTSVALDDPEAEEAREELLDE